MKMTNKEYHETTAISSSMLATMATKTPAEYKARHILKTIKFDSKALDIGSAFHLATLEPFEYVKEVIGLPKGMTRAKKDAKEIIANNPEKIVLIDSEYQMIEKMTEAISNNARASELLNNAVTVEESIFWTDSVTGLECKCRPDCISKKDDKLILVDLKSTKSAYKSEFSKAIYNYNYFSQMAWYADGVEQHYQRHVSSIVFIVCEKTEPFLAVVYDLESDAVTLGRERNKNALDKIKWCTERGKWAGLENDTINVPAWAY